MNGQNQENIEILKTTYNNDVDKYFAELNETQSTNKHHLKPALLLVSDEKFNEYLYKNCFDEKYFDLAQFYKKYGCMMFFPQANTSLLKLDLAKNFNNKVFEFLNRLDEFTFLEFAASCVDFNAYVLNTSLCSFSELLRYYKEHNALWHFLANHEVFEKAYDQKMISKQIIKKFFKSLDSLQNFEIDEFLTNPTILKMLLENKFASFFTILRLVEKHDSERGLEKLFSMQNFLSESIEKQLILDKHICAMSCAVSNIYEIDELLRNKTFVDKFLDSSSIIEISHFNEVLSKVHLDYSFLDSMTNLSSSTKNLASYLRTTQPSKRNVLDFILLHYVDSLEICQKTYEKLFRVQFNLNVDQCIKLSKIVQHSEIAQSRLRNILDAQTQKTFDFDSLRLHLTKTEKRNLLNI